MTRLSIGERITVAIVAGVVITVAIGSFAALIVIVDNIMRSFPSW